MILYGALTALSPALEEAAQTLRASRGRVFRTGDLAAAAAGAAPTRSCWASSRASPTSAIRSCCRATSSAVDEDILRHRRRAARSGTRRGARRACCSAFTLVAFWLQQRWLGRAVVRDRQRQGRRRTAGAAAAQPVARLLRRPRRVWISFTLVCYVGDLHRRVRQGHRPRRHDADRSSHFVAGFGIDAGRPQALFFTGSAWDSFFTTIEVAAVSAPLTADHRAARRLRDHAPPVRGPAGVRVPDDGELRHSRHGDRRVVHRRVQRAAAGADRRHGDPRAVLRVPQHAGRRARGRGCARADRQDARRSIVHAARIHVAHAAAGHPAAVASRRSSPRSCSASRTR